MKTMSDTEPVDEAIENIDAMVDRLIADRKRLKDLIYTHNRNRLKECSLKRSFSCFADPSVKHCGNCPRQYMIDIDKGK